MDMFGRSQSREAASWLARDETNPKPFSEFGEEPLKQACALIDPDQSTGCDHVGHHQHFVP
jgi:hypothetical protein